jgi:hypothetical protein
MTRPLFQKRHYQQVALALQYVEPNIDGRAHERVIKELADLFARDNGRFSRGAFEAACQSGANVRRRAS